MNKKQPKRDAEKYPMCEKLSNAGEERRVLQEFLEWLRVEAVDEYNEFTEESDEKLLMRYLEIDTVKLEEERRAMLDAIQEQAKRIHG